MANASQIKPIKVIGAGLVALGVLLFLSRILSLELWPLICVAPGLLFFVAMFLGGEKLAPLAIPGSIITTVGMLLLYQANFNHYESWAYAWALVFPASIGVGLIINGLWSGVDKLVRIGWRWFAVGLAIFGVLGVFFELLIGISDNAMTNIVWPLLIIGAGILLLVRRKPIKLGNPPPREMEVEFEPLDINRTRR